MSFWDSFVILLGLLVFYLLALFSFRYCAARFASPCVAVACAWPGC